ncbi:hypothetical protein OTT_0303 [Orientia tsutsugamushi str. Ikeda]|uniref:ComEC/Rec2-related protein domain-containing protein n=1 Tax=Orientia tsutsugamushi (strain Ikeda) TaxID=334380 RepID=B3CQ65_ORITI|nr:ComEC/Rec2 family competence protein [Orientia tsutsugamushi]BAG39761.1 hypothetical protein OTT_0303 [Orientia tsutsugamushi str. Ikeda]
MIISSVNKLIAEEYHNISLWFIVSFIFGIALYFALPFEPQICQILLILPIFIVIFIITRKSFLSKTLLLILFCCYLGVIVGKIRYLTANTYHIDTIIKSKIYGTIKKIHPTSRGVILVIDNCHVETSDSYNILTSIKISAFRKQVHNITIGDQVAFNATLYPLTSNKLMINELPFNILAYFNNISAIGYATSSVKLVQSNNQNNGLLSHKLIATIEHIRIKIHDRVIDALDSYLGGFINAILLGENHALNKDIIISMRQAGVSHILCISGLHLSMVAIALFIGCRFILNLSTTVAFNCDVRTIAIIISLIGSFCYLVLAGGHIATIRAFIMTSTTMVVVLIKRGVVPLRLVGLAAIIILLFNPEYIMHPSFQLSFIAVISLISCYELQSITQQHKFNVDQKDILSKIQLFFESNIYSSAIASIATAPIVIYHFYSFPNYSVLANLLIVPLTAFWVMPLTLISLLLMPFNIENYFLLLAGQGVDVIIKIAKIISTLPYAVTYFGHIDDVSLLIYLFGFLWLVIWHKPWRMIGVVIIIIAIIRTALVSKPDLVFNGELTALGIKNSNSKFEIHASSNMPEFFLNYWSNWYGQNEILFRNSAIKTFNHRIITNSGKIVAIRFKNTDECVPADLIISVIPNDKCKYTTAKIIDAAILNKSNIVEVYCHKQKCEYKTKLKSDRFKLS